MIYENTTISATKPASNKPAFFMKEQHSNSCEVHTSLGMRGAINRCVTRDKQQWLTGETVLASCCPGDPGEEEPRIPDCGLWDDTCGCAVRTPVHDSGLRESVDQCFINTSTRWEGRAADSCVPACPSRQWKGCIGTR